MQKYVLFFIYISLATTGMFFLKIGSTNNSIKIGENLMSVTINLQLVIGLMFYACSFILYTVVISKFNLSILAPLGGALIMVLSVIVGVYFLKEKLTIQNVIGIVIIIIGVVVMNLKMVGEVSV